MRQEEEGNYVKRKIVALNEESVRLGDSERERRFEKWNPLQETADCTVRPLRAGDFSKLHIFHHRFHFKTRRFNLAQTNGVNNARD